MKWYVLVGLLSSSPAAAGPNPIRKVVGLLQKMAEEIETEGEKEDEAHKKMDCYCKQNRTKMAAAGEAAAEANANLTAKMNELSAQKEQTQAELKEAKEQRETAKADLSKATKIREKEKATYDELVADLKPDLDAMDKAIAALNKGMGAEAFIQANFASGLKKAVTNFKGASVDAEDRENVMSFLEGRMEYAPASGQIVGIIMNMKDEMAADLKDEIEAEEAAVVAFKELKAAKQKEIAALSESIESKIELVGKYTLEANQAKGEAEDAADEGAKAAELAAQLEEMCATHDKDYEERVASRGQEIAAINDTIKYLNSDEALDLFKDSALGNKTSFLQRSVEKNNKVTKARAVLLDIASKKSGTVSLLAQNAATQLKSGSKGGFEKIITLIDNMVDVLKKEQVEDEKQRDWCGEELDVTDEKLKEQGRFLTAIASKIEDMKAGIETYTEAIKALIAENEDIAKSVAEAGEQRKEEHAEFQERVALNDAAGKVIGKAKNRLNKFYNPDMYQAPEKRQLTQEEKMAMAAGGEDPRIAEEAEAARKEKEAMENGTVSFVQIKKAQQPEEGGLSLGDAPQMAESGAAGRGNKNNAIMAMMDSLVRDLEKDTQAAKHEEKTAQENYEKFVKQSGEDEAANKKGITDKSGAKADLETSLETAQDKQKTTLAENEDTSKYLQELHTKCDFILEHFDMRREARSNEIDGLSNAKAVLSGANYE